MTFHANKFQRDPHLDVLTCSYCYDCVIKILTYLEIVHDMCTYPTHSSNSLISLS